MGTLYTIATLIALAGCRSHDATIVEDEPARDDAAPTAPRDAAIDAPSGWPELATFPKIAPVRLVAIPTKTSEPRFDVVGPVIAGDVAVIGGSQLGFVAVDWRHGAIAWRKQTGSRVAPPVTKDGNAVLIGECPDPPTLPDVLLGCMRVVSPAGADLAYIAIHGAGVEAFTVAAGPQRTWVLPDGKLGWRRGDVTVAVDALSGVARTTTELEAFDVHYKDRTWSIAQAADHTIVATAHGKLAWSTKRPYGNLLGAVYLPEQAPMVRAVNAGAYAGVREVTLFDIDATGSLHGQVAFPVPGIAVLGAGISSVGDAAIAVRLDSSLRRDFIVGYAANALMMWVYPLPEVTRADPIGVAVAPDAVVVFHDGDTVTILPELSAPPTAPGAIRAPLENATP